jgi:hypothetical protein
MIPVPRHSPAARIRAWRGAGSAVISVRRRAAHAWASRRKIRAAGTAGTVVTPVPRARRGAGTWPTARIGPFGIANFYAERAVVIRAADVPGRSPAQPSQHACAAGLPPASVWLVGGIAAAVSPAGNSQRGHSRGCSHAGRAEPRRPGPPAGTRTWRPGRTHPCGGRYRRRSTPRCGRSQARCRSR